MPIQVTLGAIGTLLVLQLLSRSPGVDAEVLPLHGAAWTMQFRPVEVASPPNQQEKKQESEQNQSRIRAESE
jgi:hypothetical protein